MAEQQPQDQKKKQKKKKPQRLKARQPRGFVDRDAGDIRATEAMMAKIKEVYERYGFDPVETPMFEYTDALGKFLPDTDRPNEGVFSLTDDDDQWMSLRYDLTAPLARHFAQNINDLQTPYRTYRAGYVFRNEKPGPGRFRQFMQFDADTVGAPNPSADAEMCMMMADTMKALGIDRGDYVVRLNNRKYLEGVLELAKIPESKRLDVMRCLDKKDRIGPSGVYRLLTEGRFELDDGSGDFTPGLGLDEYQVSMLSGLVTSLGEKILIGGKWYTKDKYNEYINKKYGDIEINFSDLDIEDLDIDEIEVFGPEILSDHSDDNFELDDYDYEHGEERSYSRLTNEDIIQEIDRKLIEFGRNHLIVEALDEFRAINEILRAVGYGPIRIRIDPSVVRGLEYYTGPVYECELTFPVTNEKGETVTFGSVAGGGRYDGLVKRFTGQDIPATGFSIGVSRLMTALKNLGKLETSDVLAPVIVCVMDRDTQALAGYQEMVQDLRNANVRAEMYQGNPKQFGKQLQYADRRGSPIAIIQGSDERENGIVQIKDMIEGRKQAAAIESNEEWRETRPGQFEVKQEDLVAEVQKRLAEQKAERDG